MAVLTHAFFSVSHATIRITYLDLQLATFPSTHGCTMLPCECQLSSTNEPLCQVGQATTIHHWMYEDGTEGGPAAFEAEESTERPTDEEVQKAGVQQPACILLTA